MNLNIDIQAYTSFINADPPARFERPACDRRLAQALAGALLVAAGCAVEPLGPDPAGDETSEASETRSALTAPDTLAAYDPQYKLVLPLIVNKLGARTGTLPGLGWHSSAVFQNTTAAVTSVRLTAITSSGLVAGSATSVLGPYENLVFRPDDAGYPGTVGIPAVAAGDFEGSMIVEADHRITVIAQLSNLPQAATVDGQPVQLGHPDGKASAAYAGLSVRDASSDTGRDLVYPTMKCGYAGSSTTLFVQNTGPSGGFARLDFRTKAGTLYQAWLAPAPGASQAIRCSDFGVPACSGDACIGSVSLTYNPGSLLLGAVAVELPTPPPPPAIAPPASWVMAHSFREKTGAPHDAYCPVFKNQFQAPVIGSLSATSGIAIVNACSATADFDLTFHGVASPPNAASYGTYTQRFVGIAPDMIAVASPWAGTAGGLPAGGLAWVHVHGSGSIVAQVNELSSASQGGQLCPDTPDDELFVPSFKAAFPNPTSPDAANTKITLLNVGAQPAFITAELACRGGSSYVVSRTAAPGTTVEIGPGAIPATGRFCAVRISSPGAQLVGAVQESTEGLAIPARDALIFEPSRFE